MKILSAISLFFAYAATQAQAIVHPDYYVEAAAVGLVEPTSLAFVSPSSFLVTRKNLGQITFVLNGVTMGTALDLPVANEGEEGMLGITLDPQFATNSRVYVFYSKSDIDGGTFQDDRVERYIWNGAQLIFDGVIATWPDDALQGTSSSHHGGILRIGQDGKLYVQRGDNGRNNRIELNNSTTLVGNCAAIYRLNLDGSVPADNPFVGESNIALKQMYLYGFRNGFGMDIDPVTGKLWFSENGPEVYDELNIAQPGMNSGWRLIMGPDSRNAVYNANGMTPYNANQLVYLSGASYVDPIFSWVTPIGVTGVCFLNSSKFGSQKNQVLVGNTNYGSIFLFEPNATRNGLVLSGGTSDMVADNVAERDQYMFGNSFGIVTDIVMGADGYAYACSISNSAVYRIRPKTETVNAASFTIGPGQVTGGDVTSLTASDDARLVARPTAVLTSSQPPVQIVLNGSSPFDTSSAISVRIESSASIANALQKVSLYDWQAGGYVEVSSQTVGLTDGVIQLAASSPSRFVQNGTRAVKAMVTYKAQGPLLTYPWFARIDEFSWTITK